MTRKLFWMIFAAPVLGAATLSAGAEESRKSAPAQSGIQLSEWGRETRLPELTASAWSETRDESELPDFGEFLSEEVRTLGAGALDSEQLREMMANRAIGREDDSVMSWMSSRWESAPGRLANFLTGYAETRMNALPGVESAEFNWTPTGDNAFGAFSASGVGALRLSESQALGFQPKIERAQEDGRLTGTFGLFHRRGFGDSAVAGVNIFSQHMDDPEKGSFSRWWVGADFASSWVDADFKRYIGGDGRNIWRDGRRFRTYAPDGLSAELRVHSPDMLWLEGYAKFTEWQGRGGNSDTHEKSVGVTFQPYAGPLAGLRADAEFAKDKANLEFVYAWTIGEGGILPRLADPFAVYSDIADPVDDPADFDIHDFELYESAHLYEIGDRLGLPEGVDTAELFRRVSLGWDLVDPPYMRISEHLRARCPVPQFISLWDESGGTFQRAAGANLFSWNAEGLCPTLNGDETGPLGWWVDRLPASSANLAGSLLFVFAAELADVDAVKLLIIAGANPNDMGVFSNLVSPPEPYAGSSSFVHAFPASSQQRALEGVALRISLARANHQSEHKINNLLTIAQILKSNGGECRPEKNTTGTSAGCDIDPVSQVVEGKTLTAFQRVRVPDGGLFEGSDVFPVAQGYTGEIFRITATTDYADVDYFMEQSGDNHFSITIAGSHRDYYGSQSWQGQETRYHYTGDTTVAIVHLTSRIAPAAEHSLTVKAGFFYHRNKLNTVTSSFTVQILPQPEKKTVTWNDLASGRVGLLDAPEISGETFAWTGGSPQITVRENGEVHAVAAFTERTTLTLYAEAEAPAMLGTLKFTLEAAIVRAPSVTLSAHDENWPAPPMLYASDAFTGPAFTMTVTTPVDAVAFSVHADSAFQVRTTGTIGIVNIASAIPAESNLEGTVFARLSRAGHYPATVQAAFTISVLAEQREKQTAIVRDGQRDGVLAFDYPPIPEMTFSEIETVGELGVVNENEIHLFAELQPAESAEFKLRGESPFLRGYLVLEYEALNPDLDDKRGIGESCDPAPGTVGSVDADFDVLFALSADDLCDAIKAGGSVNMEALGDDRPFPLLESALFEDNLQMQRILLAYGLDIEADTEGQGRAIHHAAYYADPRLTRHLLRRGANVNAQNVSDANKTSIHMLGDRPEGWGNDNADSAEVAQMLVNAAANVNALTDANKNYLHLVTEPDRDLDSLPVIISAGIQPNAADDDGKRPLVKAVGNFADHRAVLQPMLRGHLSRSYSLSVNITQPHDGEAAIHKVRTTEAFQLLRSRGRANINLRTTRSDESDDQQDTLMDILVRLNTPADDSLALHIHRRGGRCNSQSESDDPGISALCAGRSRPAE